MSENRKNIRVLPDKNQPIRIDINGDNFVDIFYVKNISMGGIGIEVPHRFKECSIDQDVSLIVKLPKPINKHISFSSSIIHINNQVFGISFKNLTKQDKTLLKDYISSQLNNASLFTRFAFKLGFV